MNLFKRLLAASGAAGLLIGLVGATQAFATTTTPSFTAEIALTCGNVGDTQKITVVAPGDAVVHMEVTIGASTANGGTQNGTGVTDANHTFIDQWNLGAVSANTTATVRVWALEAGGVAAGNGSFEIHPLATACPTPFASRFNGYVIDTGQYGGSVRKTCDAGVSGTAVFAPTIQIKVSYSTQDSTTFALPASLSLSLQCNGDSKQLPVLPTTSTITLHESTLPTGAAAAADTTITIGNAAVTATINNAKAAVVTTPTPTPTAMVLPATGQPASTTGIPWPALALFGLIAITGAGLVLRRRS
jgi:hypothetical protein